MEKTVKGEGCRMSIGLWAARLERPLSEGEEKRLLALIPAARRERLLRGFFFRSTSKFLASSEVSS